VKAPATHFADLIDQAVVQLSPQGGTASATGAAALLGGDRPEVITLQNWVAANCPH
jgi:hypothetical protein